MYIHVYTYTHIVCYFILFIICFEVLSVHDAQSPDDNSTV